MTTSSTRTRIIEAMGKEAHMSIALETPRQISSFSVDGFSTAPAHLFTVDDFHRMIDTGLFGKKRVQLLEGRIVDKMVHNPPHDASIALTQTTIAPMLPADWHIRVQSAITTPDSVPEPDFAVVRGSVRRYSQRHPGPKDIGMLVEVGEATLRDDQTIQYRIYARSRIAVCWIVNLVDEIVEVYTKPKGGKSPRYLKKREYAKDESVPLVIAEERIGAIPVSDLLP
jgi:Uma2 family endonuclease